MDIYPDFFEALSELNKTIIGFDHLNYSLYECKVPTFFIHYSGHTDQMNFEIYTPYWEGCKSPTFSDYFYLNNFEVAEATKKIRDWKSLADRVIQNWIRESSKEIKENT